MKNSTKFLAMAAAMLAVAGCSKSDDDVASSSTTNSTKISTVLSLGSSSKTAVDFDGYEDNASAPSVVKVTWAADDAVGAFYEEEVYDYVATNHPDDFTADYTSSWTAATFTLTSGEDTGTGVFTGTLNEDYSSYTPYYYYPASQGMQYKYTYASATDDITTQNITMPYAQTYDKENPSDYINSKLFLASDPDDRTTLKHFYALLTVKLTDFPAEMDGCSLESVSFGSINTLCHHKFASGGYSYWGTPKSAIVITTSNCTVSSSEDMYIPSLYPGDLDFTSTTFTIIAKSSDKTKSYTCEVALTLEDSKTLAKGSHNVVTVSLLDCDPDVDNLTSASFPGAGTELDPYQISSYSDIVEIRTKLTSDSEWTDGKYFQLQGDINAADASQSASATTLSFNGVFDGNGYEISNLEYAFFYSIGANGVMKNLTLSSGSVDSATSLASNVGLFCYDLSGVIDNCVVDGYFSAGSKGYVGCFVHHINQGGCIANSVNRANITSTNSDVAGFVGYQAVETNLAYYMINCVNLGNITASSNVGGLLGRATKGKLYAYNCYNAGTITATNETNMVSDLIGKNPSSFLANLFETTGLNYYYAITETDDEGTVTILENNLVSGNGTYLTATATYATAVADLKASSFMTTLNANVTSNSTYTTDNGYVVTLNEWSADSEGNYVPTKAVR